MSQDNSIQSKEKQNNTIENISSTNLYFNNIINNFNCNIDESSSKDKRILSNEISNETLSYDLHNTYQQKEFFLQINSYDSKNIETFIHLLYNELMKEMNINTNLEEELNKIKNLLNNNKKNSFELIFDIFKKSIKKLIREKTKEILDSLNQCISNLLLLEQRNKYFIQQNFLKQTKIDILENEIDTYMEMEEEFDEMKEKLKYENGKFLHNEKKENEILILRAENSNLKKIIDKNEKTIEEKDHLIESIKKQSASMINTNTNTLKNSFELNEAEHNQQTSSLIFIQNSQKTKYNHNNNSNITNFKYNIIQKIKSPNNGNNYKTNNKSQSTKIIKFENNKSNNNSKNKNKILGSRASTKELISKKIKNKVLNMKKIRRINESCLDNYNKSSAHITNSLMSNRSNNSSSKRLKKNINSFFKNKKKTMFNGINRIHKKTSSGLTNSNINNIIKSNNNKIIVNSILDNNNNSINNNNSFFFKTTRKKFGISKKNSKTNVKHQKEDYLLIRNNNSLIKSPTTFNNDIDNCVGVNNNIIINNIIQNSASMPISEVTNKSKEKINISENEQNKSNFNGNKYSYLYVKKEKNLKNKTTGFLSVNVKKKNE
jgi:hypothetical protein